MPWKRYIYRQVSAPLANLFPFRQVTIWKLSDKVLLKIFSYYMDASLDASSRFWPTLAHICRRWRHIVFGHFRLYFTHGTPVSKTIDRRLALPIVLQYGGTPTLDSPAPEDEDNIMAALKLCDRVCSMSLTVTGSLLEKLSAVEGPFSVLEDLVLLSPESPRLALPSAFGSVPRLRSLRLTRIAFFALPQLLYSSKELVDLRLHEVLNPWLLSPQALKDALSGMAQLQLLSLHFLPTPDHIGVSLPSRKRVVLPALTRLHFQGITKYLEGLVAEIDAPRLGDIEFTFVNDESITDFSELSEFIDRIEMHKSYRRAHIISSERAISISLIRPGSPTWLKFRVFCQPLALQLSTMARIFKFFFSALLSDVEDLRISAMRQSSWEDSFDSGRWLEPLNLFTGVKSFHVAGNLSTDIVRALQLPDRRSETSSVLPTLHKLYIPQPVPRHAPLTEIVLSFMTSRRLSDHHIAVEYERSSQVSELHGAGAMYAECHHHRSLTRW
jgi:hypothetical protein